MTDEPKTPPLEPEATVRRLSMQRAPSKPSKPLVRRMAPIARISIAAPHKEPKP